MDDKTKSFLQFKGNYYKIKFIVLYIFPQVTYN